MFASAPLFLKPEALLAARSDEKVQQCLKHGATWGFNYKTEDWAGNVKLAAKPAGVHMVLDCVGCARCGHAAPPWTPYCPSGRVHLQTCNAIAGMSVTLV